MAAAAALLADVSVGLTRAELFQATAPLTDRSEAAYTAAFQAALKIVLIRVTGSRTADDNPALSPLLSNARRYVQQYRGAPDGQVWVAFDGQAIERWLTQNGQPLWGNERPSTVVWLGVQTGPQSGTVVTAETNSDLKAVIDAAAIIRGIPLIWPSDADLQRNHIDYSTLSGATAGSLVEIGHAKGGDGVLIGRANNATATAAVRWSEFYQDHSGEFSGTLEGVNRLADLYAGLYAASGALAPVDLEISGVADLRDYADVQAYLESLTFVSHVSVQALTADTVLFRLNTRGGVEPLQHALALNGKFQSLPAGQNGIQRFQLHR